MRQDGIVLAALGILVLCVLAYSVISQPFTPPTPSPNLAAEPAVPVTKVDVDSPMQPPETEGKANTPDLPLPVDSSVATPRQSSEQLDMEALVKGVLGGDATHAAGNRAMKTGCVWLGCPYRFAFLQEEGLLLMLNAAGVYAFDIVSGKQVWHRYLVSSTGHRGASFRRRQVLAWSDEAVSLLDAITGRETWSRRDDQCGEMESADLSADETQVFVACTRGCILYSVADRTQRVLPKPERSWFYGWIPGNKTLLFEQHKDDSDFTGQKMLFMDTDSGAVTSGWEPPPSWNERYHPLSELGQFAEAADDGDSDTALTILDGRTGKMLREFKGIPGRTACFLWLYDAKRLLSVTKDRKQARVVDAETGTVQFALSREGHRFGMYMPEFEDASGNAWIFSEDEANNRYVWPLAPDGTPRKVLDGTGIAPGNFHLCVFDRCYALCRYRLDDKVWTNIAYTLDGMQKVAEWHVRLEKDNGFNSTINQSMTHLVCGYPLSSDGWSKPQNMAFSTFVQDKDTPVHTGQGRPMAISPDARYLALQTTGAIFCVKDMETGTIAGQFSVPVGGDGNVYMQAAFSDDGSRMVVNTGQSIEVMDLTEGYPHWPMVTRGENPFWGSPCLSPDGTRVLCGGNGCAGLFDANTGALLHTFEETEHFARVGGRSGFWGNLASTAEEWAGKVTDKFKPRGFVEVAFADGGARVITHTVGQIIRVWDVGSGNLLRTIHTGLPEKRDKNGWIDNQIVLSATGRFAFCFNGNNYGTASLWSLADGVLQRQYQLPGGETGWPQAVPADDGSAVYFQSNSNLYRWSGAPVQEDQEKTSDSVTQTITQ